MCVCVCEGGGGVGGREREQQNYIVIIIIHVAKCCSWWCEAVTFFSASLQVSLVHLVDLLVLSAWLTALDWDTPSPLYPLCRNP